MHHTVWQRHSCCDAHLLYFDDAAAGAFAAGVLLIPCSGEEQQTAVRQRICQQKKERG